MTPAIVPAPALAAPAAWRPDLAARLPRVCTAGMWLRNQSLAAVPHLRHFADAPEDDRPLALEVRLLRAWRVASEAPNVHDCCAILRRVTAFAIESAATISDKHPMFSKMLIASAGSLLGFVNDAEAGAPC